MKVKLIIAKSILKSRDENVDSNNAKHYRAVLTRLKK